LTKTEFGGKHIDGRQETNRVLKKTLNRILQNTAIGVWTTEHAGHMRQTRDDVK